MEWVVIGKLFLIVILIVGNAFFVGAEIALTSARRSRIKQLANTGNRSAKIVQLLHNEPERFYSVTQIGITLVSLGLGAIGIITLTQIMDPFVESLFGLVSDGAEVMAWAHTFSYIIAFIIISFLHVVGGELAPKVLAFHKAESLSLTVAWPINWLHTVMRPLIWIMNKSSNGLLRLFGQGDLAAQGEAHFSMTGEEIRTILSASEQEGALDPQLTMMLRGVFDLDDHIGTGRDGAPYRSGGGGAHGHGHRSAQVIPRATARALSGVRNVPGQHHRHCLDEGITEPAGQCRESGSFRGDIRSGGERGHDGALFPFPTACV